MNMKQQGRQAATYLWLAILLGCAVWPWSAPAATTFTGTGLWTDDARWSGGVPADGADAIVDGIVTNLASTAILSSYVINAGRTNVFSGTNTFLYATNVTINGTMTHLINSATTTNASGQWVPDNLLQIVAFSNVTVNANGQINVNGKGYTGLLGGNGRGPGGGTQYGYGGAYGGRYLDPYYAYGGTVYGSASAPVDPGSAGGAHSGGSTGGNGGGVVKITAVGRVTVDGTISADGGHGNNVTYASGGSGGSIYIVCGTFTGAGMIQSLGGHTGNNGYAGGGGGGRIAIVYTNTADQAGLSSAVKFDLKGGLNRPISQDMATAKPGEHGTLYFSGSHFFPVEILSGSYVLIVPGFTNWAPNSLTVTNGWIKFPGGLTFNVTNEVTIGNAGRLWVSNVVFNCGSLTLTNGGVLDVYAAMTNAAAPDHGALVNVSGNFRIAAGSTNYLYSHATNGGSVLLRMGSLVVMSGGRIDADGKGYIGGIGGTHGGVGYGLGAPGISYCGAGYGGGGGASTWNPGGGTYGSSNAPLDPGSGGSATTAFYLGGYGGGLVRIQAADMVQVDGTVSANGGVGSNHGGGGSGGGIYVTCKTFQGAGLFQAKGAAGVSTYSGGGGGGRIAIWRQQHNWTGTALDANIVAGGQGGATAFSGTNGTVVLGTVTPMGIVVNIQ